jgi:hypothetical protein
MMPKRCCFTRGAFQLSGAQFEITKRLSQGYQFHAAYTYSRSKDLFSADPGSTAGGGRPDTPNTGFSVENASRDLESNYAVSDFDRPHRFSLSAMWSLPSAGTHFYGTGRSQRSCSSNPAGHSASSARKPGCSGSDSSGSIRHQARALTMSICRAPIPTGGSTRHSCVPRPPRGDSPRNFLRGPAQKRVDLSISKDISLGNSGRAQLRWEIFNLFDTVNFGMPENNFDSSDFGTITNTVGGPRVSQLGLRLIF